MTLRSGRGRWSRAWRGALLVMLSNLAALGGALWLARDPRASAVRVVLPPTASPAPAPTTVVLHVYVSGAVVRPAVVEVMRDARAVDAVAACGGLATTADAAGINLAAPLTDGQQVHVPALGESGRGAGGAPIPATSGAGAPDGVAAGRDAGDAARAAAPLDLNRATSAELESLPGVGPALAGRIVAYREANGRFAAVDDLTAVSGIGDKTLERLRAFVTVR